MRASDDIYERRPLLDRSRNEDSHEESEGSLYGYGGVQNPHREYCRLVGITPCDIPVSARSKLPKPGPNTLYQRTKSRYSKISTYYAFTAALVNTLLMAQVVLGAALTALGASNQAPWLIATFGATNTVIAGLVAYLKSRGQPMRSRMFKDDLERVVDEIENSETMWLGIAHNIHGYDEIDIDDEVSVRSEVARLTRLYDRAVRNHLISNPDMVQGAGGGDVNFALRARGGVPAAVVPTAATDAAPGAGIAVPANAPPPPTDESPATMAKPKNDEDDNKPKDDGKKEGDEGVKNEGSSKDIKDNSKPENEEISKGESSTTAADKSKTDKTKVTAAPEPEPPAGTPLAESTEEGPVTAVSKKKNKGNGGDIANSNESLKGKDATLL